jgi:hypothetical protein
LSEYRSPFGRSTWPTFTPSRSTWYPATSVDDDAPQRRSIREEENALTLALELAGAAGAVVSVLALVVTRTVRIGERLFAASMATTPNLYAVPLCSLAAG